MEEFTIIEVPDDAPQADETMGTKEKFWYDDKRLGKCLFKKSRENTGEDWAEKIAAELCRLLGLPHARYELATWKNHNGIITPNFVPEKGWPIYGNEILHGIISDYPKTRRRKVSQHTLDVVLDTIRSKVIELPIDWTLPEGIRNAVDTFIGYILLDAWIGNTDRHHENWAIIMLESSSPPEKHPLHRHLAPTFDHASSLGREIRDDERNMRLETKDSGYSVQAYVEKCTSAFYNQEGDRKPMTTFDLFYNATRREPEAATVWLKRLAQSSREDIENIFKRIPNDRISESAIRFALEILQLNQSRLIELQENLS